MFEPVANNGVVLFELVHLLEYGCPRSVRSRRS